MTEALLGFGQRDQERRGIKALALAGAPGQGESLGCDRPGPLGIAPVERREGQVTTGQRGQSLVHRPSPQAHRDNPQRHKRLGDGTRVVGDFGDTPGRATAREWLETILPRAMTPGRATAREWLETILPRAMTPGRATAREWLVEILPRAMRPGRATAREWLMAMRPGRATAREWLMAIPRRAIAREWLPRLLVIFMVFPFA